MTKSEARAFPRTGQDDKIEQGLQVIEKVFRADAAAKWELTRALGPTVRVLIPRFSGRGTVEKRLAESLVKRSALPRAQVAAAEATKRTGIAFEVVKRPRNRNEEGFIDVQPAESAEARELLKSFLERIEQYAHANENECDRWNLHSIGWKIKKESILAPLRDARARFERERGVRIPLIQFHREVCLGNEDPYLRPGDEVCREMCGFTLYAYPPYPDIEISKLPGIEI